MRYILFAMALLLAACNMNPAASTTNIVTPTVQITETPIIPPPIFGRELGMGGFPAITLEQIGVIPANTRVNVSTMTWDGEWVYSIYDANNNYEDARESQLAFAPDVTPGAPTPTSGFNDYFNQGNVYALTLVDIGNIPAGTRVLIGSGYYGDGEWVYSISNTELGLSGEALESQLEFLEVESPIISTEIPTQRP